MADLFTVSEEGLDNSETAAQLQEMHSGERKYTRALKAHLRELTSLPCCLSTSDHAILYSNSTAAPSDTSTDAQTPGPAGNAVTEAPQSGVRPNRCVHSHLKYLNGAPRS